MKINAAKGDLVSATGVVANRFVRDGKNGPYAGANLVLDTHDHYECRWWNSDEAPPDGSRISIHGVGWRDGIASINHTRILDSSGTDGCTSTQRIIDYYRACLAAEHREHKGFAQNDRRLIFLGQFDATTTTPFDGQPIRLPTGPRLDRWRVDRVTAGAAETVYVGWPLVRSSERTYPVLLAEAQQPLADGNPDTVPATPSHPDDFDEDATSGAGAWQELAGRRSVEFDESALRKLGISSDDREQIRRDLENSTSDRVERALELLKQHGIDQTDLSWEAVAVALTDEGSAVTQHLFNDLEALKNVRPEELESGPLGAILGLRASDSYPPAVPSASALPSNLEQEAAITAAMESVLTVVTGPPGTGKSQVLANAVSAAVARGESVLLASQNNHAIDVVTQRVNSIHEAVYVHRLGRKSLRGPAASALGSVLHRSEPSDVGLDQAMRNWDTALQRVSKPYEVVQERHEIARVLSGVNLDHENLRSTLPPGVKPLDDDDDDEFLLVAQQQAMRRVQEAESATRRWWWQRRRRRRLFNDADNAVRGAIALAGTDSNAALVQLLTSKGTDRVLHVLATLVTLAAHNRRRTNLKVEHDLLPDDNQAQLQIAASFADRTTPAIELVAARFRQRMHRGGKPRRDVASYLSKLAAASNGSNHPAREAAGAAVAGLPVWAVTSLAVGSALPLVPGLFDLVIIDEATQSDIPSALPLLFRGKRAMVLGDPQQLTHITTLSASRDTEIASGYGLDDATFAAMAYTGVSLYALAASATCDEPILLRRHFRSHPMIIGFSNDLFYGSQLIVDTDVNMLIDGPPITWRHVPGYFQRGPDGNSGMNRPEAEQVLEVAMEILSEGEEPPRTLGIVTPLRPQRDLLRDLVADRLPSFAARITIDTAHGFQGDERDIMIMSPVVADRMPPGLARFAGTPNLVNVAITRARSRLIIVGDRGACLNSDTVLADLAAYAPA